MATQAQVKAFIATIAPIAIEICKKKSRKILPSICIAQACCESGCGTSAKMINANAIFGIKVGKSKAHFGTAWKDKAYSTKTKECYDGKTYVSITDMFRAYDTIEESVEDYFDMLGVCSRYAAAIGLTDPLACITAIKNAGYATSPTYITTIMKYVNNYNLAQYDTCMTGIVAAITPQEVYTPTRTYTLQSNMYIRLTAAGQNKAYSDITANAKKNGYANAEGHAILKKGTKVTCKAVVKNGSAIWIKIPSGWICAVGEKGTVYVKQSA